MKPVCALADHPLAFCRQVGQVAGEDRGGDDCFCHFAGFGEKI